MGLLRHWALLTTALLCLALNALGSVVYVDQDATGANNGTSWANAYTTLQPAITASSSGGQVWVAAGTYKPTSYPNGGSTSRFMHFSLKNGVAVYGGFVGTETLLSQRNVSANPTILSGDIGVVGTTSDNCYHAFYHPTGLNLDATAILDGVTITGGNANAGGSPHNYGGGIYNSFSSPTITNCTFSGNTATTSGGGIDNSSSSPMVKNCIIWSNSPSQVTGETPTLSYCVVQGGFAGGTDIITDDPLLGSLADNGGPTMTCAIAPSSSAVAIPEG